MARRRKKERKKKINTNEGRKERNSYI